MIKLNAAQLRKGTGYRVQGTVKKQEIYIVLDNVYDTYNIGSIFRLADAVAAKKVYLCGETATPPNSRIKKASINTIEWVAWSYKETAAKALQELKTQNSNLKTVVVEQTEKSVPYDKYSYELPIILVVGNESTGVSPEVLKMADAVIELPMFGVNISLNVMVSLGIVLYKAIEQTVTHKLPGPSQNPGQNHGQDS